MVRKCGCSLLRNGTTNGGRPQIIRQQQQALLDVLEKEAMNWHRSKVIRSYIEAATAAHIQKNGKDEPGSEFDKWKTWASEQANRLDPLSKI